MPDYSYSYNDLPENTPTNQKLKFIETEINKLEIELKKLKDTKQEIISSCSHSFFRTWRDVSYGYGLSHYTCSKCGYKSSKYTDY